MRPNDSAFTCGPTANEYDRPGTGLQIASGCAKSRGSGRQVQRSVGPHRQVRHDQAPDGHETGMVMNATHRRHAADGDAPMSGRAAPGPQSAGATHTCSLATCDSMIGKTWGEPPPSPLEYNGRRFYESCCFALAFIDLLGGCCQNLYH